MSLESSAGLAPRTIANSIPRGHRFAAAGATSLLALLAPHPVLACAACYGQSDSAMAAGMNWGIMSLLGMIVFVLGGVAGFFVFLARRSMKLSAANAAIPAPGAVAESTTRAGDLHPLETQTLAARGGASRAPALARRRASCAPSAPRARY